VRTLYLDEAGVGKISKDPILVVAGVIIHADTHWGAIANELNNLLLDAVPMGAATPSCFHAKDVFHGSGEFPRDKWPDTVRFKLLADVAALPAKYHLPIVWAAVNRKFWAVQKPDDTPLQHLRDIYVTAALVCFMQAECFMRDIPNQAEVCSIVLEQNKDLQARVPEIFSFAKSPTDTHLLEGNWQEYLPLSKLIDTPASAPKTASSVLQLADYCAFAIKRLLQGASRARDLTSPIAQQMILLRRPDLSGLGMWNPHVMPRRWNNRIELRDGRYSLKDEASE